MRRYLNENDANVLRQHIKKLGYSEKNYQLTSGGPLKSELVNVLVTLINEWFRLKGTSCKIHFTGGNDTFHKTRKSKHNTGNAVDVVLDSYCHADFNRILEKYKNSYAGFGYIDEYRFPSKGSTGGHFHISYVPGGKPELSTKAYSNNTDNLKSLEDLLSGSNTSTDISDDSDDSIDYDETISLNLLKPAIQKMVSKVPKMESVIEEIKRIKEIIK